MHPRTADNPTIRAADSRTIRAGVDDAGLIERTRSGDDTAFEELVRRNYDLVWRVVWRLVRHSGHAENLVQQVFLDARGALSDVQDVDDLTTCLRRIAVERALRFVKPRCPRPPATAGVSAVARADRGGEASEAMLFESCLQAMVDSLRSPLCLKLEGLGYDEIATTLGLSVDTVRTRLFLARDTVRKWVKRKKARHGD